MRKGRFEIKNLSKVQFCKFFDDFASFRYFQPKQYFTSNYEKFYIQEGVLYKALNFSNSP